MGVNWESESSCAIEAIFLEHFTNNICQGWPDWILDLRFGATGDIACHGLEVGNGFLRNITEKGFDCLDPFFDRK